MGDVGYFVVIGLVGVGKIVLVELLRLWVIGYLGGIVLIV